MESHSSPLPREVNASTDNVLRAAVAPGMTTALELRNPPSVNAAKTSPTTIPQSGVVLPSEAWLQVMYISLETSVIVHILILFFLFLEVIVSN